MKQFIKKIMLVAVVSLSLTACSDDWLSLTNPFAETADTFWETSEQFDHPLDYSSCELQSRETHFAKQEKYERYLYLKKALEERMTGR